jgi:glutathione peroxidase-family protein
MNLLRKIINVTYSFRMKMSKRTGLGIDIRENKNDVHPPESFHSLTAISNTDKEIAEFCKLNFGVTFPLFKKDDVKGNSKQAVYQWLSDKNKNGWNDVEPQWNFYKYLVDEKGNLANVYSSSVSPLEIGL